MMEAGDREDGTEKLVSLVVEHPVWNLVGFKGVIWLKHFSAATDQYGYPTQISLW